MTPIVLALTKTVS